MGGKKENGDRKLKPQENMCMKGVMAGGRSRVKGNFLSIYFKVGNFSTCKY